MDLGSSSGKLEPGVSHVHLAGVKERTCHTEKGEHLTLLCKSYLFC
jgi:hypothetical protein